MDQRECCCRGCEVGQFCLYPTTCTAELKLLCTLALFENGSLQSQAKLSVICRYMECGVAMRLFVLHCSLSARSQVLYVHSLRQFQEVLLSAHVAAHGHMQLRSCETSLPSLSESM